MRPTISYTFENGVEVSVTPIDNEQATVKVRTIDGEYVSTLLIEEITEALDHWRDQPEKGISL